jgi:hypothetical protein
MGFYLRFVPISIHLVRSTADKVPSGLNEGLKAGSKGMSGI